MQNSLKGEILNKAIGLLSKYPLCDSCLGRCFARLSYGHSNEERGKAIKLAALMELDRMIKEHEVNNLEELKEIFYNIGEEASPLFSLYFSGEFQKRECYICGNRIKEIKEKFEKKALNILREKGYKTFVLGVNLPRYLKRLEEEFIVNNDLVYYESIKNEIKRDVGKRISEKGFTPAFEEAEVELVYDFEYDTVIEVKKTYKTLVFYNRLSRGIPISRWYAKDGKSLEGFLANSKLYVPFSEPSEYRVLEEYPLIIEGEVKDIAGYYFKSYGKVQGRELSTIFTLKPSNKTYRITIYSNLEISEAIKIYEGVYDLFITVRNAEELKAKIAELENKGVKIIGIDLVTTSGKVNTLYSIYIKDNR
ncbi:pseudouridylate synthase [Stygiolobus caldivivus]|uniref:Pseudouridylate synthase n=1 Tax=Stygiolobus caldivivus TaxID=2824673 RepID=A0A8D5U875_9CREN|nr:pseudouridylate synthase [Stygiolobus caldivivus]BCU71148.1 pseudouridylate synthase [Stygiolobus caldivivus]